MKLLKQYVVMCLAALTLALASQPLHAAECADVFAGDINPNLGSNGLDLSGVSWGSEPWPASGSTLTGGDYYFSGTTLGNNYSLNIASGEQVRIFVSGSLGMGYNFELNANGDPSQLLLVVQGNLVFGNNAEVSGLVYAGGSVGRSSPGQGSAPDIEGSVAAGGAIDVPSGSVDYDVDPESSSLLAGLCDRDVELSANGMEVGPVVVDVGESVDFSVTARNCPSAIAVWGDNEWIDEWSVSGSGATTEGFDDSPCSRDPLTRSLSFSQPGTYTIGYSADYCSSQNRWGFCNGYTRFGSDDIVVEVRDETAGLNCETQDDFNDGPLDPDLWVTSRSSGNFTPSVVQNRLRVTEAVSNQATAATLQAEIPGDENLVILRFDYYAYGGSGADGIAVVLSDALVTPQPGSYGGSLGYAQRTGGSAGDGFAGGWLGVGIDEYGNFAAASEGRQGGRPGGRTPQSISIRGSGEGSDGYEYLAGTGTLDPGIDSTGQSNFHTYEIRIDSRQEGQAVVSVRRDTGSGMETLIAPFDVLNNAAQDAVPENLLLSITGSTGGSTNIHELDNVELCALRINEVGEQVHHFEIEHDGVGLTCQAEEQITIRACATSTCNEDELFTDTVVASMAPSGWVGGDSVTINGGEATASFRKTTPGTVELGVTGSNPSTRPQSVTLCRSGNSGLSAANCDLRFYDTGLVFDVPDMVANEVETGIPVRAVRTEGSPEQACVPAFENVTRDVDFWSAYINPDDSGVSATPPVAVNGNAVSGSSASPTSIPLSFDGNGVATIDVNYQDAGRMQLSAAYQGSAANDDQGLTMPGADQFVSRPYGFCIEAISPDAACGSPLADCSVLATAGDPFDLGVRAVASESGGNGNLCVGNATTRNFRASLEMDHSLEAPSDGAPGTAGETEAVFAQADAGEIIVQQSVTEVGVFNFSIPAGQPYLATSLPGAQSADTGRFIPARFEVTTGAVDPGALEAGCIIGGADDIHYVGQPMGWAMPPAVPLVALNRQGLVTENYTRGGFRKLTGSDVARQFPTTDEAQTISDGTSLLPAEFDDQDGDIQTDNTSSPGLMDYVFSSDDVFWYPKTREALVAPFPPALAFELTSIEDSDGVQASSLPYEFTAGLAVDADTGNTFEVRYGRLAMENVYGPENLDELLMPVTLEAWNGTSWQPHEAGSCLPNDLTAVSDASETTSDHHSLDTSGLQLGSVSGEYFLRLVPDGSQGTDTIHWPLSSGVGSGQPPAEHDWLMDFWGRDPAPDELQNPQGLATFGVYRGHDRIIYWREVAN